MSTKPTDIPVNLDGTWDDPTWGEQGGPFFVPPHEDAGLAPGDKLASNTWNYELQHLARWIRATRDRMVLSDRGLFGSFLLPGSATWTLTGGSLDAWLGATWVLVDVDDNGGVVVEYNVPAGDPHTFASNATTEVYLKEDGTAVYRVVGVDPAPADAVLVWEVVTDGTEVTSATVKLPTIPVLKSVQVEGVDVDGDLAVSGNVVVAGDVAIGGVCTMKDALAVSGAVTMESTLGVAGTLTVGGDTTISGNVTCEEFTATGEANFGGDVIVAGLIEVGGSVSINSSLGVTSNATVGGTLGVTGAVTCNGGLTVADGQTLTSNGNTILGNADTDTLTVNATSTFAAPIDFGANTITGPGGTITTSTVNGSTVGTTQLLFNTHTTSSTNGAVKYNGRKLTVGDGSAARTIHSPRSAYVVSHTIQGDDGTVDITGASVQMIIENTEWVYVRVSAKMTVDDSGFAPTLMVSASNGVDSVLALNNGDADVASILLPATTAPNQARPVTIVTRWRPINDVAVPNNPGWTLQVRHDVTGNGDVNLTTSNVHLEVWYE